MSQSRCLRLGFVALSLMSLVALVGCREDDATPVPMAESVSVEGEPVIVTRLVERTVEVRVTAAPIPGGEELSPIALDLSMQIDSLPPLDPQQTTDEDSLDLIENLFVGLTRLDHETGEALPALAERWDVSPDGLRWTFDLRDDVYWVRALRSGQVERLRRVTAEDVVYAARRACDPATTTPFAFVLYVIEGCQAVNRAASVTAADLSAVGVRALNSQTVQFGLTRPASHFLALTTLWLLRPLPQETIDELGEEWDDPANVVSSGPFVLSRASVTDRQTILVRNPFWPIPFRGNVDVVNLYHVGTDTAFSLWQEKALDLSPVPAAELASVRAEVLPRYDLIETQEVFYLGYNFDSEVFRYPEVRRALGAAIDRETLIDEAYGGRGLPMRHLVPEGVQGALPRDEVGSGYNPDYARQQMNASPYRDCRLLPPIRYLVSSLDVELQQAEVIRQMWVDELACAEDQIIIEQVQFGKLLADTQADAIQQRPDVWHLGWAAYYPDAENYFAILACDGSENRQRRPCSDVDQLIRSAATTASLAERPGLYREIERAFFGQEGIEPITPLFTRARFIMRQVWLDYSPASFGGEQYDTYLISWEEKQLERTQ